MKRIALFITTLFAALSICVCTYAYDIKNTAELFAEFSPEITVVSKDIDQVIADIFEYDPRLVMYYKGYNSVYNSFIATIKPVYTNTDVALTDIYTAKSKEEFTDLITRAMLYGRTRLCVVGINMPVSSTPLNDYIEEVSESCPLAYMGYRGHRTTTIDSKQGAYTCYVIDLEYDYQPDILLQMKKLTEQKAAEIVSTNICENMPPYMKEYIIHDYIVENCQYATDYDTNPNPDYYTAYGALIGGKAVCNGYAYAAKLLLDLCGIENSIITGTSKGIGHAWNIVKLDDAYYHMDTTWDDPVSFDGLDHHTHEYYNMNDGEISRDHIWELQKYPKAMGGTYTLANTEKLIRNDGNSYNARYKSFPSVFGKYPELGESENPNKKPVQSEQSSDNMDIFTDKFFYNEDNTPKTDKAHEIIFIVTEHIRDHKEYYLGACIVLILLLIINRKIKKRRDRR